MWEVTRRWFDAAQTAWPLFFIIVLAASLFSYQLGSRNSTPLPPPFAFTNGTTTIKASGAWHTPGSSIPNATNIFCWFPANGCQVTVAELARDGTRARLRLTDKEFDIIQLSDATLTAVATSTDSCHVQTLRIDRNAHAVTLSVGSNQTATCAGTPVQTATLGG